MNCSICDKKLIGLWQVKFCSRQCYFKSIINDNHPKYKNKVGYPRIHAWLYRWYGKAKKCEANMIKIRCSNKIKKYEWAKIKNKKYERKRENFLQLCISCHRIYDWNKQ